MSDSIKFSVYRILLQTLIVSFVGMGSVHAQFAFGVDAAPALETITMREATIARGYNLMLVPQASLRCRFDAGKYFGLRLSAGWMPKGAKVWFEADSTLGYPEGRSPLQGRYLAARLGMELKAPLTDAFSVVGSFDFVGGRLIQSRRIIPGYGVIPFDNFFSKGFFGLDFAVELQYRLANGIEFRFSPTLEIQLNQAYKSNFFLPEFRGFAPRIAVFFPVGGF